MNNIIRLSTMRPVETVRALLGQIVRYTGNAANPSGFGAVIGIDESRSCGAYHVALNDGREFRATNLDSSRWIILPEVSGQMDLAQLRAGVEVKKASDAARETAAKEQYASDKARLQANNPHLIIGDGCVIAAKNIRIELRRAFPGVTFSVKSKSYSGGNSIDISWTDGPNSAQVEAFTGKYSGGDFDGMTDSYNYRDTPWTALFGEANYVHTSRHYSDAMVEAVMGRVCRRLGGMEVLPTVADYNSGNLYSFKQSGGCDVRREVHQALSKHTFCIQTTKGE